MKETLGQLAEKCKFESGIESFVESGFAFPLAALAVLEKKQTCLKKLRKKQQTNNKNQIINNKKNTWLQKADFEGNTWEICKKTEKKRKNMQV